MDKRIETRFDKIESGLLNQGESALQRHLFTLLSLCTSACPQTGANTIIFPEAMVPGRPNIAEE